MITLNDKWRLIALDIDGTTLVRGRYLSDDNREWLYRARDQGIEFTFATGRHRLGSVSQLVEELNITMPVVSMNGSEVWSPSGGLLARHSLAAEDVAWLHSLAVRYHAHFWSGTADGVFQEHEFPTDVFRHTWLKFGFYVEDEAVVASLWEELKDKGRFELTNSHPLNIEVNPVGVTKAKGLQVVADYLGLEPHQFVAIGDSLNDLPMIRWAGLGIAMGNAQEVVKQEADWTTRPCDEHGVAYAVEQLLKGAIAPRGRQ